MTLNFYTRWKCEFEKYNMYFKKKALSYAFTFFEGCLRNAKQFGNVQKNPGSVENNELPLFLPFICPFILTKMPLFGPLILGYCPFLKCGSYGWYTLNFTVQCTFNIELCYTLNCSV